MAYATDLVALICETRFELSELSDHCREDGRTVDARDVTTLLQLRHALRVLRTALRDVEYDTRAVPKS